MLMERLGLAGTGRKATVLRGMAAGVLAATALAVWFLVIDALAGRPLHTPAFLAQVLLGAESAVLGPGQIALYTVIHYAAFVAVGAGVGWLMHRLQVVPGLLLGVVLGFLLFDLLFYGSVWFTGVDVVRQLGWPEVLIGNIIAGITLTGTVALASPQQNVSWSEALRDHQIIRDGLAVGLIGAGVVAVWFLVVDVAMGRLLFTPAALGSVVFHGATTPAGVQVDALTVIGYSGLHLAAFLGTGIVAAAIVGYAEQRHPYVLLGGVLLFVAFQTFLIGVLTILAQWLLALIPWWSILLANLLAAGSMGAYLWVKHPLLARALSDPDLERDVEVDAETPAIRGSETWPGGPDRR